MTALPDTPDTPADHIRRLRLGKDLTQSELAQLVGVDQMSVSRWERGTYWPTSRNRKALAAVLGGDPTDYRRGNGQ